MSPTDPSLTKFKSGNSSLIGLLRYFPLEQFTRARSVEFLRPLLQTSLTTHEVILCVVLVQEHSWTCKARMMTRSYMYCKLESFQDPSCPPGTRGLLTREYSHESPP